ncbi:MAG: hypothetical protein KF726_22160 [Anaerolineae bacterium]|nr:hypothetical protein [Anaerolineae bacterium]
MKNLLRLRTLILIWLSWALIMIGYQIYVAARFQPSRPDNALSWTANETRRNSNDGKIYLLEPFLNDHVAWDSEYYLSIAVGGYDDPAMRAVPPNFSWNSPILKPKGEEPTWTSQNYSFFPLYPTVMRFVMIPLQVFGLTAIATATLAGVLVSLLGTLGAMVALWDLARDDLGESGARRAAFYLLILPGSMFLAQIYTEGLFLGLSFGALALARRDKWLWAALLAALAVWTRAAGFLLLVPMIWYWFQNGHFTKLRLKSSLPELWIVVLLFVPLLSWLLWNIVIGTPFQFVSTTYYSRGILLLDESRKAWENAWTALTTGHPNSQAYYLVEFASIAFGVFCSLWMLRRYPALALYSLLVIFFSLTSGVAQGMHRYVLAAPVIFLLPANWGKHEAFDRAWTLGNVLLMGVFAAMFTFDYWAG